MSEVELGAHVPSSEKIKRSSKSVVRACVYGSWLGGQVCMTSWFPTKRLFILWARSKHASSSAPHISSSLGLFSMSSNHLAYVDMSHASSSEFPEAQRHGASMHSCLPQRGPQASKLPGAESASITQQELNKHFELMHFYGWSFYRDLLSIHSVKWLAMFLTSPVPTGLLEIPSPWMTLLSWFL